MYSSDSRSFEDEIVQNIEYIVGRASALGRTLNQPALLCRLSSQQ